MFPGTVNKLLGFAVPIPTLFEFGSMTNVFESKLRPFPRTTVVVAAEEDAIVITFESRQVLPAMENVVAGVTVAIPRRRFVASTVRKVAESMVEAPEEY